MLVICSGEYRWTEHRHLVSAPTIVQAGLLDIHLRSERNLFAKIATFDAIGSKPSEEQHASCQQLLRDELGFSEDQTKTFPRLDVGRLQAARLRS